MDTPMQQQQSLRTNTPTPSEIDTHESLYYDAPSTPITDPVELSTWITSSRKGKERVVEEEPEPNVEPRGRSSERDTTPTQDSSLETDTPPHPFLFPSSLVNSRDIEENRMDKEDEDEEEDHGWLPAVDKPLPTAASQSTVTPNTHSRKGSVLRKKPPPAISSPSPTSSGSRTPRRSSSVLSKHSNVSHTSEGSRSRRRNSRSSSCPPPRTSNVDSEEPPKRSLSKRSVRSAAASNRSINVTPVQSPSPSSHGHTPRRTLSKRSARSPPQRFSPLERSEAVVVVDSSHTRAKEKEEKRRRKKSVLVKKHRSQSISIPPTINNEQSRSQRERDRGMEEHHQAQLDKALQELASLERAQRDIGERVSQKRREVEFLMGHSPLSEESHPGPRVGPNGWSMKETYPSERGRSMSGRKVPGFGALGKLFHGAW